MLIKLIALAALFAVAANLFLALFHLIRAEQGGSRKTLKFLTFRLVISIVLFASLYVLAHFGYIQPHGFPQQHTVASIDTANTAK